jgi:hypothetical protein
MSKERFRQRAVYWVTAALVASLVGGFALAATFTTGGQNNAYQGSQTTTIQGVAGLSYVSTNLIELSGNVVNTTCSLASPCDVSAGTAVDCAGGLGVVTGCLATDFIEQVNLTTIVGTQFPGSHEVKLTLFVTGTPAGGSSETVASASLYYTESVVPGTAYVVTLDFDVGSISTGPGLIQTVTVIGNGV